MNIDTGAIAEFETEEDAKAAGHTEPLTKDEATRLRGMNRHERRAALAKMRREMRKTRRFENAPHTAGPNKGE